MTTNTAPPSEALSRLAALLGTAGCMTGDQIPAACRSDASMTGQQGPVALLRPASVEEVSQALAICSAAGLCIVPQGGMTGLAGAANPGKGQVALSMARFHGVEALDATAGTITLRAGTILQQAQQQAEAAGALFPIDLGARGSCQIGGLIATNAGGLRVLRYGTTRDNLLGLEVVLADGTVLSHLNEAVKDNTGLDLKQVILGSEGTLAVVTRAVFRLAPQPAPIHSAICALPSPEAAPDLLRRAREALPLQAFETMWPSYLTLVEGLEQTRLFDETPGLAVLIEAECPLENFLETAFEDGLIVDALLAQSLAEAQTFWALREGHRIDAALPGLMNFDVSLPIGEMAAYVAETTAAIGNIDAGAAVHFFGHMADGNLHAVLHAPGADAAGLHGMEAAIYGGIRARGGAISAEHGIGTLKRDWLEHSRSADEIALMRRIKAAFDPGGLLNPGKVF
ncbi:FAD-binding oxidoreductase [Pseudooceanicola algae]|uniref:Putative FAD-linked oxidoreductase n=1 Tax=Pseudooceanicola algae TaxID=1537215 RepID=A0A418SHS2_9RHOB|nr:FAD-binding oxidoreductase [Pseudooceanicola algae]QPM90293.1 putative FAD-linked oxidoreductase [Pseudooceanicola algae]